MLHELRISNVAIIDGLTLSFGPGLNVITGETGTGKSILLRAMGLLCGARANADMLRSEADTATIEGVFDFTIGSEAADAFGLSDEDELIIRRQIDRNGKGRIRVNGAASTATMLREISTNLVHIYGQHEQSLLLRPANHLDYLDAYGGLRDTRKEMTQAFSALVEAQRQLEGLESRARSLVERRDLLDFQRGELASAAPVEGEETQLRADRERLRHADRIAQVCSDGENDIYAAENSMDSRLARLVTDLEGLAAAVPDLESPAELVEQGRLLLEEAALQMRTLASHAESDPAQLDAVEERLSTLTRLAKKYGVPASELPTVLAQVEEELASVATHSDDRERAADVVEARLRDAAEVATRLSRARRKAAKKLQKAMSSELADLGMDGGVFEVAQETSSMDSIEDLGASGADRIEFHLSANTGEPTQSLAKVASGGELSRILLALKSLTAGIAETPVLIFDEVDAGIGGTIADAVARKLRTLAETHQVLCITHLAQIAACADHHFAVEKSQRGGRTISDTRVLSESERIAEISRMLGDASSEEATQYARQLVEQGRKHSRRQNAEA